ncbi:MAG TPA: hypothetical protein ENJ43_01800 [Gammaproteobacteria bacterium]|nr:hypothetical protein [Gammaproteobacteria bacterium]
MKRQLLCLLLLTNICASTALAWDIHPEPLAGHDIVVFERQTAEPHTHSDGERHHANHCCHGAAHLTGCINESAALAVNPNRLQYLSPAATLPSLYLTPHLRPPIA